MNIKKAWTSFLAGALITFGANNAQAQNYTSGQTIDLARIVRQMPYSTRRDTRVPLDHYVLERDPGETLNAYRIGAGIGNYSTSQRGQRGFLNDRSTLEWREVDEIKLSIDNAMGLTLDYVGKETGFDDYIAGRAIGLSALIGVMSATSYFAHEEAGHALSFAGNGIVRDPATILDTLPNYREYIDRHVGGLNNSEYLFWRYSEHAVQTRLNLVNSIGIVSSKIDPLIQWIYSFKYNKEVDTTQKVNEIRQRILAKSTSTESRIELDVNSLVGYGDNRAYVALRDLHGNGSKSEDLKMTLFTMLLNPNFYQSLWVPLRYLYDGTKSQESWHIPVGQTKIYLPQIAIYRRPEGYLGETRIQVKPFEDNNTIISARFATGIGQNRKALSSVLAGVGVMNVELPGGLGIDANVWGNFRSSTLTGFGASGRLRYELTKGFNLYASADYKNNSPTGRPGFDIENTFFSAGIEIGLDE